MILLCHFTPRPVEPDALLIFLRFHVRSYRRGRRQRRHQSRRLGKKAVERYGLSVTASGDTIAVGAPYRAVGNNPSQGAVALFRRTGTTWALDGEASANDGGVGDYLGYSVSLSGNKLVAGAPGPEEGKNSAGSAYLFTRATNSALTWTQRTKLLPPDGVAGDHFGNAVAASGNTVLVAAPGKTNSSPVSLQQAYVFVAADAAGERWTHQHTLTLGEGSPYGSLSVALHGSAGISTPRLVGWDKALRRPTRAIQAATWAVVTAVEGAWWDGEDLTHPTRPPTAGWRAAGC